MLRTPTDETEGLRKKIAAAREEAESAGLTVDFGRQMRGRLSTSFVVSASLADFEGRSRITRLEV